MACPKILLLLGSWTFSALSLMLATFMINLCIFWSFTELDKVSIKECHVDSILPISCLIILLKWMFNMKIYFNSWWKRMYTENLYDSLRNAGKNMFSPFFSIWEETTCQDVVQDLHFCKSNCGVPASGMWVLVKQLVSNATMHFFKSILLVCIHRPVCNLPKNKHAHTCFFLCKLKYTSFYVRGNRRHERSVEEHFCFANINFKRGMVGWQVSEESGIINTLAPWAKNCKL